MQLQQNRQHRLLWLAALSCGLIVFTWYALYNHSAKVAALLPHVSWTSESQSSPAASASTSAPLAPVRLPASAKEGASSLGVPNTTFNDSVVVVVASRLSDNTSWLEEELPQFDIVKYVTDDLDAEVSVPVNKGHEAMVYLTYIIDHYHALPSITIFSHAQRYQWHNDDPLFDGARALSHLRLPHVLRRGYVSLRCAWKYGCPAEILPFAHGEHPQPPADPAALFLQDVKPYYYKPAFEAMFPGKAVPRVVAAPCCAQFAVSAAQVRARSKGEYQRVRRWLIETELPDNVSGRLMEYIWHVLFGQEAVACERAETCYCEVFGRCGLEVGGGEGEEKGDCNADGSGCDGLWKFPEGETLPEGWPERGWDGEEQDWRAMAREVDARYRVHGGER